MTADRPAARFAVDVPPEMLEAMTGGGQIAPRISRDEALQVPAVLRTRNLIAGTLASLPHVIHGPDRREVNDTYLLGGNIDPDIPNSVLWAQTYEDLLFEGISWWRVTKFGWHGYPVNAQHVPVGSVHVAGTPALPSRMRISPDQPFPADGQVYIDGYPIPDREIIRFDSPNPPLLRHAARAIRTCLLLDQTAALYAKEPMPLGVFEPTEGSDGLSDEPGSAGDGTERSEIEKALDDWAESRRKRAWGYLQGMKANALQWNPEQLQLADQRQHAVLEIARAGGIDPEDLGVSTTSRTYQNGETRRQDLLDFTLGTYVSAVQDRLSMRDIVPRNYHGKVKFGGFLRSDTKTRMETYDVGRRVGAYDDERVAELEDIPLSAVKNAMQQQRATQQRTESAAAQPALDAMATAGVEFSADPESTCVTFTGDDVAATFRVNTERRTVSGLAVPWGKVARSGFAKWKFLPDSLHWSSDTRVKMNLDHDHKQTVGRGVRLQSTSLGLDSTFKVARGAEGDRALAYAEDGVYDGFSIEVTFDGPDDGWTQDPHDESVNLVHSASLRAVALTAMPAFDDARLTSVNASRDNNTKGQAHASDQGANQGRGRGFAGRRVRVQFH